MKRGRHFLDKFPPHIACLTDVNLRSNNGKNFAPPAPGKPAISSSVKERTKERLPRRGKTRGGFEEEKADEEDGIYNFPYRRPSSETVFHSQRYILDGYTVYPKRVCTWL